MTLTIFQPPAMPLNEAARADAVLASGALDLMGDPVLHRIVDGARRALHTAMAAATVIHEDWQYIIGASGFQTGVDSRRTSFCGHAINADAPIFVVPDARRDPRFAGNPAVVEGLSIRFYAAALLGEGHRPPIGTLCVFDPAPRAAMSMAGQAVLRGAADRVVARFRQVRGDEGWALPQERDGASWAQPGWMPGAAAQT